MLLDPTEVPFPPRVFVSWTIERSWRRTVQLCSTVQAHRYTLLICHVPSLLSPSPPPIRVCESSPPSCWPRSLWALQRFRVEDVRVSERVRHTHICAVPQKLQPQDGTRVGQQRIWQPLRGTAAETATVFVTAFVFFLPSHSTFERHGFTLRAAQGGLIVVGSGRCDRIQEGWQRLAHAFAQGKCPSAAADEIVPVLSSQIYPYNASQPASQKSCVLLRYSYLLDCPRF